MNKFFLSLNFLIFLQYIECRDFYLGMFRKNDFLVAQDVIFKQAAHFGYATASYGRVFKCPITYFRVVDRLGMGRGPYTTVVRGGLKKNYIVARIRSTYNIPVSVNVYVGCENKVPSTMKLLTRATEAVNEVTTGGGGGGDDASKGDNPATSPAEGGDATTAAATEA